VEKRIIEGLRAYYNLPDDMADERIIEVCEGSLGKTSVTLSFALNDLKAALLDSPIGRVSEKCVEKMSSFLNRWSG